MQANSPQNLFPNPIGIIFSKLFFIVPLSLLFAIAFTRDLSELILMFVLSGFILLTISVATLRGKEKIFFAGLLINACLYGYQLVVYFYGLHEWKILMLAPIILIGIIYSKLIWEFKLENKLIIFLWLMLFIPSILQLVFVPELSYDGYFINSIATMILPLIFFQLFNLVANNVSKEDIVFMIFSSIMLASIILMLIFPIETLLRTSEGLLNITSTEYSSSYSHIGLVTLTWPFIATALTKKNFFVRTFFVGIIFIVFLTSFSRGAILIFFSLIGISALFFQDGMKLVRSIIFAGFLVILSLYLVAGDFLLAIFDYWVARLNLFDSSGETLTATDGNFFDLSARFDIWSFAFSGIEKNFLFGHGTGSSSEYFAFQTLDALRFSSMHSIAITTLYEKGIFGLLALIFLVFVLVYKICRLKDPILMKLGILCCLALYFLFATVTGDELFINSSTSLNIDKSIYLLLYIGFVSKYKSFSSNVS